MQDTDAVAITGAGVGVAEGYERVMFSVADVVPV
jgi:hypothetical protein